MTAPRWSLGSRWLRWDPHLHAPGTLRNDQFGGDWDGYIRRIEEAQPAPIALGITDYFTLRGYKEVLRRRQAGALGSVALVFPNVELRLTIETKDRQGINLHLLVCPDEADHVARIEEKLAQLLFTYRDGVFPCTDDGLRRLGVAHRNDRSLTDELALAEGANQFKVELSALRRLKNDDPWIRNNVLFAVAAGNDGLAGISKDASLSAQREELGRFAQVVFSGNPSDRAYWLGQHADFVANGQTPKACLHGSDAHQIDAVLAPAGARRCWIRAEPTFDGLRQTLVEPGRRVHIGEDVPDGPSASDVIRVLRFRGTAWIENQELELNDGLVTVIGSKGSGKTALADLLAAAADADEEEPGPASFVAKAGDLLSGVEIEIEWGDGARQSTALPRSELDRGEARVRYLSQQFVERLCSASGLAVTLVEEIERVVFSAIAEEDRLQCSTFAELRATALEGPVADGDAEREAIRTKTRLVADETKLQRALLTLRSKVQEAERALKALEKELAAIPVKASDDKVRAQEAVAAKLKALKEAIAAEERRAQSVRDLSAEVQRQARGADVTLASLKVKFEGLLDDAGWELLRLRVDSRAIDTLSKLESASRTRVANLRAHGLRDAGEVAVAGGVGTPMGLAALTAEDERLTKELGLDHANAKRRADLVNRIAVAKQGEDKAKRDLAHAEKSPERIKVAQTERLSHYESIFGALAEQESALRKIYEPLGRRIASDSRLGKLSLVVDRVIDVDAWASRGEGLLDLRKPPFQRRGLLAEAARKTLLAAWRRGTPKDASDAMRAFLSQHASAALEALAQGVTPLELGEWLFSTDHIGVRYGIQYEGVEIAHLSPGTRGVVLLTLYLALDEWDRRPLIIDQPEENLDPRSVYADLVPFFRDAAKRRQIIMVTHNANLVVNTDSDQVIVAEAERSSPTALPKVTYTAGGLEDPQVREDVCRLLEGGREAFLKRSQRYGVHR